MGQNGKTGFLALARSGSGFPDFQWHQRDPQVKPDPWIPLPCLQVPWFGRDKAKRAGNGFAGFSGFAGSGSRISGVRPSGRDRGVSPDPTVPHLCWQRDHKHFSTVTLVKCNIMSKLQITPKFCLLLPLKQIKFFMYSLQYCPWPTLGECNPLACILDKKGDITK